MSKLRKSSYDAQGFERNEGQRGLLCSNKASTRCPSLSSSVLLSDHSLVALEELGDVLKRIHLRMKSEGYCIENGKVVEISKHE